MGQLGARHGTRSNYNNNGCRCDECRAACRAYNAERLMRPGKREQNNAARNALYRAQAEYVREAKSRPCADCGQTFPSFVMDFDHVPERGDKRWGVASAVGGVSLETLKAEIAKCEVVCANCHRIRTESRRRSGE